jgi:hypothetical protein
MLNEYDNLHNEQKTMVTLVYKMKTSKRPSLIATNLIISLKRQIIFFKMFSQVKTEAKNDFY